MSDERHPHFNLVKANMETALGGFYTALYRDSGWIGGYSDDIEDFFWNMVVPVAEDPETDLSEVKDFFDGLDREATLYGENEWIEKFIDRKGISGLELKFTDAWMRFEGEFVEATEEFDYVRVDSEDRKEVFVEIFADAFGEDNEDDPYGGLGEGYYKGVMRSLNSVFGADTCKNLIARKDGDFVGIGTLAIKGDIAFVYNIATRPSDQGKGVGTALTRKVLELVDDEEIEEFVLQTESGSYVEDFYQDLGFETFMEMKGFTGL